uniref:ABC2_membrane domain-containing protein n=1 Tax=Panagrellus redivivus TaxID=6233 RepID=A0A7E4VLS3_PANRE
MDCIEVYQEEYDDVVEFMLGFSGSFENKFTVHDDCFPSELMAKLNEAFKFHETHSKIIPYGNSSNLNYFNHRRYWFFYYIICLVCCTMSVVFTVVAQQTLAVQSMFNEEMTTGCYLFIFYSIMFFEFLLPSAQLVFMIVSLFQFKPADVVTRNAVNDDD